MINYDFALLSQFAQSNRWCPSLMLIMSITTVAREISKIWNVILLNIIREPCSKSFSGFIYEIGMFTSKKWICYRNIETQLFKLQRGNEMATILFFVGKLSGHACILLQLGIAFKDGQLILVT